MTNEEIKKKIIKIVQKFKWTCKQEITLDLKISSSQASKALSDLLKQGLLIQKGYQQDSWYEPKGKN